MLGSIVTRYLKHCETKENHRDENLKTHYYKGTFRQVFETVEKLLRQDTKYIVEHVSIEHGEFSVRIKNSYNYDCIITLVAVRPLEVAVDIHISTDSFSLLGAYPSLKNEIVNFYQTMKKTATFIGAGKNI